MRPSRRIERIARHDAESEPRIEARGLRILLIDIDTPHAAAGDGMFHETPPQPPAPQVGRDEKHLEHPVRNSREGGETAAGTADDSPERRRPRLRHRETRRPTQCAPARKEPQEIKYRSAAPPRKSIRAIAGRRQKAHAHRRIPTATIVPPQLVRRSAPLQPDQIGRCRSTVSRRCSLSRCV